MNRHVGWPASTMCWLVVASILGCVAPHVIAQTPTASNARCSTIQAGGNIKFRDMTLRETADIPAAEIRRINTVISNRCYEEANDAVEQYVATHPDDYQISFVQSRLLWLLTSASAAEVRLLEVLHDHPSFASAKVLLASIYMSQQQNDQAKALLDSAAVDAPNDLWLFLDRLKLEAGQIPSADTTQKYFEILQNPQFPPSARETSALALINSPSASNSMTDAAYRIQLSFESATPYAMKAFNYAHYLVEQVHRETDGIQLINDLQRDPRNVQKKKQLNLLLAYAYLSQAAEIDSNPSVKNARLIELAKQSVDGDVVDLYAFVGEVSGGRRLRSLLSAQIDQHATDQYGRTPLCNAVSVLEPDLVLDALSKGADPNAECDNTSILGRVVLMPVTYGVRERQTILRALLQHGAKLEYVKDCQDSLGGDCKEVLLPILREFEVKTR